MRKRTIVRHFIRCFFVLFGSFELTACAGSNSTLEASSADSSADFQAFSAQFALEPNLAANVQAAMSLSPSKYLSFFYQKMGAAAPSSELLDKFQAKFVSMREFVASGADAGRALTEAEFTAGFSHIQKILASDSYASGLSEAEKRKMDGLLAKLSIYSVHQVTGTGLALVGGKSVTFDVPEKPGKPISRKYLGCQSRTKNGISVNCERLQAALDMGWNRLGDGVAAAQHQEWAHRWGLCHQEDVQKAWDKDDPKCSTAAASDHY